MWMWPNRGDCIIPSGLMRTSRGLFALLLLLAGLTGCPRRSPSATDVLETAAKQAQEGNSEARTLAFAGFHAYLVAGDTAGAQARFDAAVAKDPGEPYALMGQHLLARRAAAVDRALAAALELVGRAPNHPLAVAATRYMLDQIGTSPEMDEAILRGAQRALEAGATGEAAQLLRGCRMGVFLVRGDRKAMDEAVRDVGAAPVATLLGPFSPLHLLAFDELTPPEQNGSLVGPFTGVYGPLTPRTLQSPDGRHRLEGEPGESDVYLLAFDAEVPEEGVYLARSVSSSSHKVWVNGAVLFERRSFMQLQPTITGQAVRLPAGKHRFIVKLLKDGATGNISFSLPRADGRPSQVRFTAAAGPAPSWQGGVPLVEQVPLFFPGAQQLAAALEEEAGGLLATFLAIRDGMGRDPDGSQRLMLGLEQVQTPALVSLRAEMAAQDRSVPTKVARGRATRDLEVVQAKDPSNVAALLLRAELALSDSQPTTAQEVLKNAQEHAGPSSFPFHLLKARTAVALGVDAQAEDALAAALKAQPHLCEALGLRYSLARRRDAAAVMDQLMTEFTGCPGMLNRVAEHARQRGDTAGAAKAYAELLVMDPGNVSVGATLASLHVALRRYDEAAATLRELLTLWPRAAILYKRLADVREYAGDTKEALALREQALAIDGSDLSLRRAVERAKTGKELLQDYAIDGKTAIAEYEASRGEESAAAAYVLDAAAVQLFPGGTLVNRIHTIQKVLEQSGIQEIAEVNIPTGAQVLALRTIKANGTMLEPENIEGKESISLPGMQVGDYVEVEYLLVEQGRLPGQPGFTASEFYFQVANMPNNRAVYTVVAPKGTGMRVDAHGMKPPPPPVTKGDWEVFTYEARRMPPFIPEPDMPWSNHEYLPFVIVGAGPTGNDRMLAHYADSFFERSKRSAEIEAFARKTAEGKTGLEAVRALHSAIMKRLTGRDVGLMQSAISSLAQDRGSRLMLLKASLESLGMPARIAVIRPFTSDPAPYLFAADGLLAYSTLRVQVSESETIWVDTTIRFGPFGQLPENALGEHSGYLLPEPGRPVEQLKTPPWVEPPPKKVELELELKEDGTLTGRGLETYSGFEGANLADAFEALSADTRQQSLQNAVARYFSGADLTMVKLEHEKEVGAPFILRYEFKVPRFARLEGDKRMVLGPLAFPAQLGRRYVQLSSRDSPMLLENSEVSDTVVHVTLPEGWKLSDPQPELKVNSAFGSFRRTEKQEGRVLIINEWLRIPRVRVYPKQYEAFSSFAADVDLIQLRDLTITP
jgi:tetratricopeptide (TPR) repeat protein